MTEIGWDSYRYRVLSGEMVTPVIRELWLEPVGPAMPFRAGQYLLLSDAGFAVPQRSYSVANAPRPDGRLSVLVTLVPQGPTSTWAHRLPAGSEVSVEGPFGTFTATATASGPVLLLGAGSGLAPVRALAEALLDPATPEGAARRDVTLFFSGRTPADAIDRATFEALDRAQERFEYRVTYTREPSQRRHRRIPELLSAEFDTLLGTEVFTAGPPGFVTDCQAAARRLGAADALVHTEEFFTDPVPWTDLMPPAPTPLTPEGIR